MKQHEGVLNVKLKKISDLMVDVAVVPHPSGQNRFWVNPPKGTKEILEKIKTTILRTIGDT